MAFVCPAYEDYAEPKQTCCVCCAKEEPKHHHNEPEPKHHHHNEPEPKHHHHGHHEPQLPEILLCFKENDRSNHHRHAEKQNNSHNYHHDKEPFHKLSQSKSRELRASILYTGCDCLKRDGLQHDCRRTGCHGSPECVVQPPVCKPSQIVEERDRLREKIREKYVNRSKNGQKNQNGDGHGHGHGNGGTVNYRCYPVRLQSPVPCCRKICPALLD